MALLEEEESEAEAEEVDLVVVVVAASAAGVVVADLDFLSVGEVVAVDLDDDIVCRVVLVMEIYVCVYERQREVRSVGESFKSLGEVIDFSRFI